MTWNLTVPVETRMCLLKRWEKVQLENIQDDCEHPSFKNGECEACGFKCEHPVIEDGNCLDCGEFVEPFEAECD